MSHREDSKQQSNNCDECGNISGTNPDNCIFCLSFLESFATDKQSQPVALGSGNGLDIQPIQPFKIETQICSECYQPLGSNIRGCEICASVAELPTNSAQPKINYHDDFGPMKDSFGPCTDETTKKTLVNFRISFEVSKRHGFPFTGITGFKRSASLLRMLLSLGVIIGFEGMNNSCFFISALWILSQGNMHERINIDCLSGHILYKILWDLRCGLFVGRDIVEAFRLSLRDYPGFQRTIQKTSMDDPILLLSILEDVEIIRKGPILSQTGCSFHIHEVRGDNPASSIQEALCASVSSPSSVTENDSIISFQFCQQRGNGLFTGQTLGTDFKFPHDGVILNGKLLRPKMFIIYTSKHYLVVLCVGEAFFLSNSLSASQCGHFLPETLEISETDAMELFRTQAHTIVFECVGNFLPPPIQPPSVSDTWFLPPPPQASSAQVAWFPPPPPPPAPSASGPLVPRPSPLPAPLIVWFFDNYRMYDPNEKVLRSILTGRIIDDIRAGTYEVRVKDTHEMVRIELREVPSDDVPPPPRPTPSAGVDLALSFPHKRSQIQDTDIVVNGTNWSCEGRKHCGTVEKTPHPQYPQFLMEVYLFNKQRYTEIKKLIEFLNFYESVNGSE